MLWVEFMGFVEDFSAKVNKYSETGEHKNIFVISFGLLCTYFLLYIPCANFIETFI